MRRAAYPPFLLSPPGRTSHMRLLLFRHAKSSWDHPGRSDHDRPLAPRGERAAAAMSQLLREEGWIPDAALVSSARRTQETADLLFEGLPSVPAADVIVDPDLYLASARGILALVAATPSHLDSLMVIGHNPGMHELAAHMAQRAQGGEADRLQAKFPTAGLAIFEVSVQDWAHFRPALATLRTFICPKDLPDAEAQGL